MGKVTQDQLQRADEIAKKNREAAAQIEQAGRGLHQAMQQCLGNTAHLGTISTLAAVQAYVSDALRVLLEKEETAAPENRLLVPKGK